MPKLARMAAALVSLLAGGAAGAQSVPVTIPPPALDTRLYRLPVDAEATLWTNDAGTAPTGHWRAKVGMDHMVNPLTYLAPNGSTVHVLSGVSALELVGGVQLGMFRVGLDVPVLLRVQGDQLAPVSGMGDLALETKATVLDRDTRDGPTGVAGLLRVSVPSSTVDAAVGTRGVGVDVEGIVDHRMGPVLVAANLGSRWLPRAAIGSLEWGSLGYGRLGAGWFLAEDAGVSIDLVGHLVYGIPLSTAAGHPAEGILGGFGRVHEQVVLRGGIGTGLSGGVGAPDLRVVAAVGFEPEEVRDRDEDGIRDHLDACPLQAEDPDGYADDDGCPDPTERVTLSVRSLLGTPLPEARMTVQTEGGPTEGGAELTLDLHPGTWQVAAWADRYEEAEVSFVVAAGRETRVDVSLVPRFGELRVIVQDPTGAYLSGTLVVDGERPVRVSGGVGRAEAMAGDRRATVQVEGYFPATLDAEVRAGQRTNQTVVLEPILATLGDELIELLQPVRFDDAMPEVHPDSQLLLNQVADILLGHPELERVTIETRSTGPENSLRNRIRSAARADAVRRYLVDRGVAEGRLVAVGIGVAATDGADPDGESTTTVFRIEQRAR